MNLIAKGERERKDYYRMIVFEARKSYYWIMLNGKLYTPDEAAAIDPIPQFTHESLIAVDPVKVLEREDKKMAERIHAYNQRRIELVRKINLTQPGKVM